MEFNPGELAGTATIGTITLIGVIRYIWRRYNKDAVEVVKDRAEVNIIEILQKQVQTVLKENKILRNESNENAKRIGHLEALAKNSENHLNTIDKMQTTLDHMQISLDEQQMKFKKLIKKHSKELDELKCLLKNKTEELNKIYLEHAQWKPEE